MMTTTTDAVVTRLYRAGSTPELIRVPELAFVMIDGHGDPKTSPRYQEAVGALYAVSYAVKFALKRAGGADFKVAPLEELWWAKDMTRFTAQDKADWDWTMMIRQPGRADPAPRPVHRRGPRPHRRGTGRPRSARNEVVISVVTRSRRDPDRSRVSPTAAAVTCSTCPTARSATTSTAPDGTDRPMPHQATTPGSPATSSGPPWTSPPHDRTHPDSPPAGPTRQTPRRTPPDRSSDVDPTPGPGPRAPSTRVAVMRSAACARWPRSVRATVSKSGTRTR